jgi:hypothetical protein
MGWDNSIVRRSKDGALVYEAEMLAARLALLWVQARPFTETDVRLYRLWNVARKRAARRRGR